MESLIFLEENLDYNLPPYLLLVFSISAEMYPENVINFGNNGLILKAVKLNAVLKIEIS
jgi:hypothetical protein